MASDVREIGNAVLDVTDREGIKISNLALNKIIYFAHAWFLALYSRPLLDSPFEAWQFGPVHPQVYRQMRRYKDGPVTGRLTRIDLDTGRDVAVEPRLTVEQSEHVERMSRFYGVRSASWLVAATHEPGTPWDQVWSAAQERSVPGMVIPDELTRAYYQNKLIRRG